MVTVRHQIGVVTHLKKIKYHPKMHPPKFLSTNTASFNAETEISNEYGLIFQNRSSKSQNNIALQDPKIIRAEKCYMGNCSGNPQWQKYYPMTTTRTAYMAMVKISQKNFGQRIYCNSTLESKDLAIF